MPPFFGIREEWILENGIEKFIEEQIDENFHPFVTELTRLFNSGHEIAYIARYCCFNLGGMEIEDVGKGYKAFKKGHEINREARRVLNYVENKIGDLSELMLVNSKIKNCKKISELDEIRRSYKPPGGDKTRVEIARELGFEEIGKRIMEGENIELSTLKTAELDTRGKVEEQVRYIIADILHKMEKTVEIVQNLSQLKDPKFNIIVKSELSEHMLKNMDDPDNKRLHDHYLNYVQFSKEAKNVKDYEILALNRAEENRVINWKVEISSREAREIHPFREFRSIIHQRHEQLFEDSVDYSIRYLFVKKIKKLTRKHLVEWAYEKSVEWFCRNLKQAFSREPIKGMYVIALDPGYRICKAAFLKPDGSVIETFQFGMMGDRFATNGEELFQQWAGKYPNVIFAIGNGNGTIQTQRALSEMNERYAFGEMIPFCVVSEDGASKYSITEEAAREFPGMKPTEISAVSIGRRLIDTMGELVKIEPQHLGKGMYQHSINCNKLKDALQLVVRETVSLRGVDVNTASENLLSKICGLDKEKAAKIVKYRQENGGIQSREELKKIPGIDQSTFTQCAGFLTVWNTQDNEERAVKKRKPMVQYNPLDATIIHPDQYELATGLLIKFGLEIEDVGNFEKIYKTSREYCLELNGEEQAVLNLMLTKPELIPAPRLMYIIRESFSLREKVEGVIHNQTAFGIFVDIGAGKEALVHADNYKDIDIKEWPKIGTDGEFKIEKIHGKNGNIYVVPL